MKIIRIIFMNSEDTLLSGTASGSVITESETLNGSFIFCVGSNYSAANEVTPSMALDAVRRTIQGSSPTGFSINVGVYSTSVSGTLSNTYNIPANVEYGCAIAIKADNLLDSVQYKFTLTTTGCCNKYGTYCIGDTIEDNTYYYGSYIKDNWDPILDSGGNLWYCNWVSLGVSRNITFNNVSGNYTLTFQTSSSTIATFSANITSAAYTITPAFTVTWPSSGGIIQTDTRTLNVTVHNDELCSPAPISLTCALLEPLTSVLGFTDANSTSINDISDGGLIDLGVNPVNGGYITPVTNPAIIMSGGTGTVDTGTSVILPVVIKNTTAGFAVGAARIRVTGTYNNVSSSSETNLGYSIGSALVTSGAYKLRNTTDGKVKSNLNPGVSTITAYNTWVLYQQKTDKFAGRNSSVISGRCFDESENVVTVIKSTNT